MKRLVLLGVSLVFCVSIFAGRGSGTASAVSDSSATIIVSVDGESGPGLAAQLCDRSHLKLSSIKDSAWKECWLLARAQIQQARKALVLYRKMLEDVLDKCCQSSHEAIAGGHAQAQISPKKPSGWVRRFVCGGKGYEVQLPPWFQPFNRAYYDLHHVLRQYLSAAVALKMGKFLPEKDRAGKYQKILALVPRLGSLECLSCGFSCEYVEKSRCPGCNHTVVSLFITGTEKRAIDKNKKKMLAWVLAHYPLFEDALNRCMHELLIA